MQQGRVCIKVKNLRAADQRTEGSSEGDDRAAFAAPEDFRFVSTG
jgi:hypothetical protein